MNQDKFGFPTETVKLPSGGIIYNENSVLSNGEVEMKYMTAQHEDILTNSNFIRQGTVLNKLLESMIVTQGFKPEELISGDKDGLLVAARILGFGAKYIIPFTNPNTNIKENITIDLSEIKEKELNTALFVKGKNEFNFELPNTNNVLTFKFPTGNDELKIKQEINGLQKLNPQGSYDLTTKLKHIILSVNGNSETKFIREFIDKEFILSDVKAFNKHINEMMPGLNMVFDYNKDGYVEEGISIPMNVNFFWPAD